MKKIWKPEKGQRFSAYTNAAPDKNIMEKSLISKDVNPGGMG
jgi:hypothetical protein